MLHIKKVAIDSSLVMLGVSTVIGVTLLANMYLMRKAVAPDSITCTRQGEAHLVAISDDVPSPVSTTAKLCDTLTILNKDTKIRLMAFGSHGDHQPYDGITEQVLAENQSFTIVLNRPGTYLFHDHNDVTVSGTFTVNKS